MLKQKSLLIACLFFIVAIMNSTLSFANQTSDTSFIDEIKELSKFNLISFGDMTLKNSDVQGKVFVGGNLDMQSFAIGSGLKNTDDALIVAGEMNFKDSQIYGNLFIPNHENYKNISILGKKGNFDSNSKKIIINKLNKLNDKLSKKITLEPKLKDSKYTIECSESINVVSLNNINSIKELSILKSQSLKKSILIINTNEKNINLDNISFNVISDDIFVIWNFSSAESITLNTSLPKDLIFAPNAKFNGFHGNFNGLLIAKSIICTGGSNTEFHKMKFFNFDFTSCEKPSEKPSNSKEPTSSTEKPSQTSSPTVSPSAPSVSSSAPTISEAPKSTTISATSVTTSQNPSSLPKTGESSPFTYVIVGLLIICSGLGIFFFIKYKTN